MRLSGIQPAIGDCQQRIQRLALLLAGLLISGCSAFASPLLTQRQLCLSNGDSRWPVQVEVAKTLKEKRRGLQHRHSLAADSGMLFVYDNAQPGDHGFWMYRTLLPLDIAFLDSDGTILNIHQMRPCTASDPQQCRVYPAGKPFHYALEVNLGYFASHGIDVGDRVLLASCP